MNQSPLVKINAEERQRQDDIQKQEIEQRVADALKEKELAMQREFEAKMKALQAEHSQ